MSEQEVEQFYLDLESDKKPIGKPILSEEDEWHEAGEYE